MSATGLMNQTCTIYSKTGYNEYGRETVGSGTDVKCRFQETTKRRLLPDGSMITIAGVVYVPSDTTIETDYQVDYLTNKFKVFGVYTAVNGQGNTNHIKLELVKWRETA